MKPRIRLINKLTLIVLTLTTLWALWIVAPTKSMLIQLLSRSSSPEISLAFLQQLFKNDPQNRDIVRQIANNYFALGQLEAAENLLENMLVMDNGEYDGQALTLYVDILVAHIFQQDEPKSQDARKRLSHLLQPPPQVKDSEIARKLADIALAFSMPASAYQLLYPFQATPITNTQELIDLALQSNNQHNAIALQTARFYESDSMQDATYLFSLFVSANAIQANRDFFQQYQGSLRQDIAFLDTAINHCEQIGDQLLALELALERLAISPSHSLYSNASRTAIALGDIKLATQLLESALALDSSVTTSHSNVSNTAINQNEYSDMVTLHQLYRWQNETGRALSMSRQLYQHSNNVIHLKNGIDEARALIDLDSEAEFFNLLASSNQITLADYSEWLDAVEKALGTPIAHSKLNQLIQKRPNDPALLSHKARQLMSFNNHADVITTSLTLAKIRQLTQNEARRLATAYIMTYQPERALNALTQHSGWQLADNDYLETVDLLAWETGEIEISAVAQQLLIERSAQYLDSSRYAQALMPLNNDKAARLMRLYQQTNDDTLLLIVIQYYSEQNDVEQLTHLLSIAANSLNLADHQTVMLLRARLAELQGDTSLATANYLALLQHYPNNTLAIESLIWLALNNNDQDQLAAVYHKYKTPLLNQPALWPAFASASQQLGLFRESEVWYRKQLMDSASPLLLLSFARLLEQAGKADTAYQLKRFILQEKTDALLKHPNGEFGFRDMLALFVDDKLAYQLSQTITLVEPTNDRVAEFFTHLLGQNNTDNILLWQQRSALGTFQLPDWQALSIALQRKDRLEIERILATALRLPEADKHVALQLVNQHQSAWQHGQQSLGRMPDKKAEQQLRLIHVQQHPNKVHSVRGQATSLSPWGITRYSVDYFAPHRNGHWRLGTDYQQADTAELFLHNQESKETRLRGQYFHDTSNEDWRFSFDFADGVGDIRTGLFAEHVFIIDDDLSGSVQLGINTHQEASQLMTIAGQSDFAGFNLNYQPTIRESVHWQSRYHNYTTRFGDDIGAGWEMSVRAAEQLFFTDPAWRIYLDYSQQQVSLSEAPLLGVNHWQQRQTAFSSGDFIDEHYQRIAIGQRFWHGQPGTPGATAPSPTYWFDSNLGYNIGNANLDVGLSAGIGWRLIGNDELYFNFDWQSQDKSGDESLRIHFGYYYNF
ncbi:tetratricopeptide repeat protein [Thaumasiovibrio sp. DFM-14]|uniref:tetratricopeptide repeat protein n=1 Tax=Thaumasiovibrio sp. DFM-14 TaxID=3384792 RepID=UPI0039A2E8D8